MPHKNRLYITNEKIHLFHIFITYQIYKFIILDTCIFLSLNKSHEIKLLVFVSAEKSN